MLKELLKELDRQKEELRLRANKAMTSLGDIEKLEVGQPVISALRELDWLQDRLGDLSNYWAEKIGDIDKFVAGVEGTFVAASIEAGKVVKKEDHESLLTAAKKAAVAEAETNFAAEREADKKAADLRASLIEEIGVTAAAVITDEDLKADDSAARITTFKARATKLAECGLDQEEYKGAYVDLLACGLDEAGIKAFDARFSSFEPILAQLKKPAGKKPGEELGEGKDKKVPGAGFRASTEDSETESEPALIG